MNHSFGLLAAALLLAGSASAQKLKTAQVPAAVVAGFTQKFLQAKDVKWEKENDHYEAGFKQGKAEMSALLLANGALVETETEISVAQLPAEIRATLARQYKGVTIKEAAKIVAAGTGAVTYEAEIAQGGKTRDVLFNADGQEVKQ
ncbi:PepSY-like domain-containing protein [Hymenobacter psychrophilus]|uniref:Putative beta-lactamase-inhibitor-like, PepSY-like n=1 Tax=Hymenobacter psychrophilus TaxID=651662 RepID=A0A1H3B9Q2_9BACT|nr:PepSY-like domain-containing protein [Hymenobacter psychrophilus]SDX38682.1 Putative beta-lactamase-inhibitor-like, PepSY-like [Hymenobacter psychrophilus]